MYGLLLSLLADLEAHRLFSDQCSELGLIIVDVEVVLDAADDGVLARNGYIRDADLALVSTADLDSLLGGVLNDHDAFLFLTRALQDEVVSRGLVHPDHLLREAGGLPSHLHVAGKLSLTDLALEFGEVVMLRTADHLFLDLDPNPFGEAIKVNRPA